MGSNMDEEADEMIESAKYIENKANAYHFLGTQDEHVTRLFHWIKLIEHFSDEVRASEADEELYQELIKINKRLVNEVGHRMSMIFP